MFLERVWFQSWIISTDGSASATQHRVCKELLCFCCVAVGIIWVHLFSPLKIKTFWRWIWNSLNDLQVWVSDHISLMHSTDTTDEGPRCTEKSYFKTERHDDQDLNRFWLGDWEVKHTSTPVLRISSYTGWDSIT